jgi:hypothetical protein
MTEAAAGTEHASKNTAAPDPAKDRPSGTAAAEPCGCSGRIDGLETQIGRVWDVVRTSGWLTLAITAAVIYILWADALGSGKGDSK